MDTRLLARLALSLVFVSAGCSAEVGPGSGVDAAALDAAPEDDAAALDAAPPRDASAPRDAQLDGAMPPCADDVDCDDGTYCNGAERCVPTSATADARGCVRGSASPCASGESCDEATRACTTTCVDADHDGACASADCDDTDAARYPMAHEVCDAAGVDEDCNPATLGDDADGDGHVSLACCNTSASGALVCGDDCDDMRSDVSPAATEVCDHAAGIDENCDGRVDEGCVCDVGTSRACTLPGACAAGTELCSGTSWGACSIAEAAEVCNGIDDDCDALVDEGVQIDCWEDRDDDGWAEDGAMLVPSCAVPGREAVGGCPMGMTGTAPTPGAIDCLGLNASVHPGAPELCTLPGRDDDCDGVVNDGCACALGTIREPCVAAGVCGGLYSRETCQLVGGVASWVCNMSPTPEICDGEDDDCDGLVDEALLVACWRDADGDGYAAAGALRTMQCSCGVGTTARDPASAHDCDDTRPEAHPGAADPYDNGLDDDCDGVDGRVAMAVFVSTTGDDTRSGRTPRDPVRTFSHARALAVRCSPGPCTVLARTGTFTEAHMLTSGVSMWGGYGPTYAALAPGATVLASGTTVGLRADAITSPTRIGRFTVQSVDAIDPSGAAASIAIRVTNTPLRMLELVDVIGSAGRGRNGAAGVAGGTAPACTRASGGAGGSGGGCGGSSVGTGAPGGSFTGEGLGGVLGSRPDPSGVTMLWGLAGVDDCTGACDTAHAGAGFPGMDGFPGPAAPGGSAGGTGPWLGSFDSSGVFVLAHAPSGAVGRRGGGGGGGGEGGDVTWGGVLGDCTQCFDSDSGPLGCSPSQDCMQSDPLNGANGGAGGDGGCGGLGGLGGENGGGSFGIVVVASTVTLTRVTFVLGGGGDGGAGGAGSPGTAGLAGAGDGAREDCCYAASATCHRALSGNGGHGGHGGRGSGGGGGAGGDAGPEVGVALVGSTASVVGSTPVPTVVRDGVPGVGGAGGSGDIVSSSGVAGRRSAPMSAHAY